MSPMMTTKPCELHAGQIKKARAAAGLTQRDLAGRITSSVASISRLETGRARPSTGTLERIANATGHRLEVALVSVQRPATAEDDLEEQNNKLRRALRSFLYLAKPHWDEPGQDVLDGLPDSQAFALGFAMAHAGENIILAGQIRRARQLVE